MTAPAQVGDVVMTPTNVQATVTAIRGTDRYADVTVREHTPERYMNTWRQGQLVVQRAAALREAAATLEHGAEFNVNETLGWTPEEQAANNRLINQSRELHARADALERSPSWVIGLRGFNRATLEPSNV